MAKRRARPIASAQTSRAWETRRIKRNRQLALESTRSHAIGQPRELADRELAELERLYRGSENIGLIYEALKWCAIYDCCPQWVASAVVCLFDDARQGQNRLQKWWKEREKFLTHWRRFLLFEEGRRQGLTRPKAAQYALEALRDTRAGGSVTVQAIEASVKFVQRMPRGMARLTDADWQWLRSAFPQSENERAALGRLHSGAYK